MRLFTCQAAAGSIRREIFEGREHLVAPVIALVAGVVNGELAPADEIGRYVDAWNGIPLPIGHPMERGMHVSANRPDLIETRSVGRFFNASFDGERLRGEVWVDIEKAKALGGEALTTLERLEAGEPLEVSTAYFQDVEETPGKYNGRPYSGIQRNLRPDHLALLPSEIGACSWQDGCGAPRVNAKGGAPSGMSWNKKLLTVLGRILGVNEGESHESVRDLLESAMRQTTGDPMSFFIQEVFDDHFVYAVGNDWTEGPVRTLYRRTYSIGENQEVTLGEAEEVIREVTYAPVEEETETEPATNRGATAKPPAPAAHTKGDGRQVRTKQLASQIIANTATQFTEADRSWLESLTEAQLQKMVPGAPAANTGSPCSKQGAAAPATNAGAPAKAKTAEEYLSTIDDPEVREVMANALRAQRAHREQLIAALAANTKVAFSKEELGSFTTENLEKLARSIEGENYAAMGAPRANQAADDSDAPPAPPPVVLAKKEGK